MGGRDSLARTKDKELISSFKPAFSDVYVWIPVERPGGWHDDMSCEHATVPTTYGCPQNLFRGMRF